MRCQPTQLLCALFILCLFYPIFSPLTASFQACSLLSLLLFSPTVGTLGDHNPISPSQRVFPVEFTPCVQPSQMQSTHFFIYVKDLWEPLRGAPSWGLQIIDYHCCYLIKHIGVHFLNCAKDTIFFGKHTVYPNDLEACPKETSDCQ